MKIISSELYVKDNKVYHEGNKPKPKDIGAAPETHTHNYASATTPGGSAEHAIKATEDSLGQRIDTYIKGLSVSGRTITYTRGDGTTGTITTQDNNTDTKVTNTLDTTAKAYITGTTNSATNTGTQVFDTNVYLDTTAGMLTATTFKGALQGNAATATSATSATSATKLATARTINGTSFNGTGNITTANWGTARNIQIGNSSKSVNGSSNMTWTLAEIGAAPDGHTHSYLPLTGGTMTGVITSSVNTGSYLDGNKGKSIINSTNAAGGYTALIKSNSTNGYFTQATYQGNHLLQYTAKSTVDAGTNGITKSAVLLNESGNTSFPGTVTAPTFSGALSGNATSSTSASHAARLTTPRTINGTNFDGTAAITTSHWGTARTLTIGNTGKSVNGSGNVSWSIGEIGAAPTVHNHTSLTGITNLSFATEGSDSGSITTTVDGTNTYFDFNLSDDPAQNDMWRWRFTPSGGTLFNAMTLDAISTTEAKLAVTGEVQATRLKGTLTGNVTGNVTGTVSGNAGSATKLATPRTINGTNFDGTANITTANWGTARTITIGSKGKSVNGSGNVSWTLDEIGAAPTSHTHNYAGSSSVGGAANSAVKLQTARTITLGNQMSGSSTFDGSANITINASLKYIDISSGNLNTYTTDGLYRCISQGGSNNVTNKPIDTADAINGFVLEVKRLRNVSDSDANVLQTFYFKNRIWTRIGTMASAGTTWEAWRENVFADGSISGNAGSATKLQTARTINGTSFNGTGNITTANWGTARNITIGSTKKSVNGSGDVAWSLSEIGAAAASHTHNYAGSSSAGGAANSAIKATQDSAGQQINTTYIKGLSVSGRTITFTKGDGTTGTLTTQDTNTTYSVGTASALGLTKLYTGTGTATDGTMTQAAINSALGGKANSSHTHSTLTGTTGSTIAPSTGTGVIRYDYNVSSANAGTLPVSNNANGVLTLNTHSGNYYNQLGFSSNGNLYYRAFNGAALDTTTAWKQIAFTNSSITGNAATATTLQNARTINGTSFNGSANITTANWGTARTIYIADNAGSNTGAGVSVNGSGNATLKLPATIAATLSGNASTATKLATARTISLGGILSGSASFDGSGNVTISAAANDITTITKSLKVTTSWMDTGITGTNLTTGTYAVQMLVNDGTNTSQYNEHYSGIMSWFNGTTNSGDADEILLHKAGHASNGKHVYLRTIRTTNSGYLKLQICSSSAFAAASSITFKFKKLI